MPVEQQRAHQPQSFSHDAFTALKLTAASSRNSLIRSWIYVPIGVTAMLVPCFGLSLLFAHFNTAFPASVACLMLLFGGLLLAEASLGTRFTRKAVALISVPGEWALMWISLFLTPPLLQLPLSPAVGVGEVFKMIAVFVAGFVVMMAMAAYMARSVQYFTAPKRSDDQDERRDSQVPLQERSSTDSLPLPLPPPPQLRVQEHHYSQETGPTAVVASTAPSYTQEPPPPTRAERWATMLTKHMDAVIMVAVFVFIGIPLYFSTGYAMPAHLAANTLAYYAAMAVPLPWKTFLHPLPVASLLTVLVVWPLAAIRGDSLTTALEAYKTGANYLYLWTVGAHGDKLPGAGDVFGTILDAGIVALALPMFQHRRELRNHYFGILLPNVVIAAGSLFVYPPLCVALGISPARSLAFPSRSLTLALALPATKNLGGDVATVAALAIASGISGVLVGQKMLAWMRIPDDDYVTRGITLGVNSSAIATAVLLRTDPRAAALSSLSMTLFGTVTVLFTSIPPMVAVVRSLVGL